MSGETRDPGPERPRRRRRPVMSWIIGLVALALAVGVATQGIRARIETESKLRRETGERRFVVVALTAAKRGPATQELILPGNVQSFYEAPIYARTNGYLKRWTVDIGTRVKRDQLLAEIDTPEVDDQLRQAEAELLTAQANNGLAQSTAKRWQSLLSTDSVSKQETDEKVGAAQAMAASVSSARANVARLRQLESFKRVLAPFDGVVTQRRTDIGQLINAGSGTGPELFRVAQTDPLRVYVQVPQPYSPSVGLGLPVELRFAEYPGRSFPAKLVRTAEALDPATRTLLVELQTPNPKGELLPGGYTEVHFDLPASATSVRLPVNTLLFRADGLRVATIDRDSRVVLKNITIGRDFGSEVEVTQGLAMGDQVIVNPPDSLLDGQQVRLAQPKQQNEAAAQGKGPESGQERSQGQDASKGAKP